MIIPWLVNLLRDLVIDLSLQFYESKKESFFLSLHSSLTEDLFWLWKQGQLSEQKSFIQFGCQFNLPVV